MTGPSVAIKLFGIERTRAWRSVLNVVRKRRRNFIINFRGSSPATDVGRRRRYLVGALNFNRFLFLFIFRFFFFFFCSVVFDFVLVLQPSRTPVFVWRFSGVRPTTTFCRVWALSSFGNHDNPIRGLN